MSEDHLDVGLTLKRLESGVAPVPVEMSLASLAISMNRMANCLYNIETLLRANQGLIGRLDDLRYAVNNVSNNGQAAAAVANNANAALTNVGNIL